MMTVAPTKRICHFTSIYVALIAFILVGFHKNKDLLITYKFQVDNVNKQKDSKYNMIIENNILYDLQINLLFSGERTRWCSPNNLFDYDSIPMK